MIKSSLKKFLNERVYLLAKLKTKKADPAQSEIDQILENLDEGDKGFKNLDETRDFLAKHRKSTVVNPEEEESSSEEPVETFKKEKAPVDKTFILTLLALAGFVVYWKYFR